jgi:site-specific DNA-methyltransferase (adenine-specific)
VSNDHQILCGDCLDIVSALEPGSVDLVITSPPYGDRRTYGIDFDLTGDAWVQWAADRFEACYMACNGLTAWVVGGWTEQFRWSVTPALLVAELHRRGVAMRHPLIYQRSGTPGSGGPDWFRCNYEWIICAAVGRLPWSDNTAMGHPPKCKPGGAPSNRDKKGNRKGDRRAYKPPKIANPGSIIDCGAGGGGNLGSKMAHEGDAPFPERIPEWFIRSCCPPGGVVLDPFAGTGTTAKVAKKFGRRSLSIDIRQCECERTRRRLLEVPDESEEAVA